MWLVILETGIQNSKTLFIKLILFKVLLSINLSVLDIFKKRVGAKVFRLSLVMEKKFSGKGQLTENFINKFRNYWSIPICHSKYITLVSIIKNKLTPEWILEGSDYELFKKNLLMKMKFRKSENMLVVSSNYLWKYFWNYLQYVE